jgi:hypothetical protein
MVIIQLVDELFAFNLNGSDNAKGKFVENRIFRLQGENETKMIKYFMQRGPGEQVYYGEKNEVGVDQLV